MPVPRSGLTTTIELKGYWEPGKEKPACFFNIEIHI